MHKLKMGEADFINSLKPMPPMTINLSTQEFQLEKYLKMKNGVLWYSTTLQAVK